MFNFNKNYKYIVMIDEREVSFEYFGDDFNTAVKTFSDIKAKRPSANVLFFHDGKEIPLT